MSFTHRALPSFWKNYDKLPEWVRRRADKQFELLSDNPDHPSLNLKPVGDYWSARVTLDIRAMAYRQGNTLYWFWIGPHSEYDRINSGS